MINHPRIRLQFGLKLFLSHFLAVLLVSGSIGTFFYLNAIDSLVQSLRSRLQNSAALLSQGLDARNLESIRSAADIETADYLIGIDMRADEVDQQLSEIRLTGLLSLVASLLLALVFALYLSRGFTVRINTLIRHCQRIAMGHFDETITMRTFDEFDNLITAFNTMSDELAQARTQADQAIHELREARDNIETHVEDRTRELKNALEKVQVLTGMLPICCSCKKIRNDKGYWQQVEHFVSIHTGVQFSHGLCPECATALYGDILMRKDPLPQ